MSVKHFLSIADVTPDDLSYLIDLSLAMNKGQHRRMRPLEGKIAGIYFRRSSTRTRTAFTVGAVHLGAQVIQYGPNDLQIITGETFEDTARVLANFLDVLVVRTNDSVTEMEALTRQDRMAVINAMSENEHPTQAIADLVTIKDAFGRLDDVHILYMGEGNNSASALALAVSRIPGMNLTLVTPKDYGLPESLIEEVSGSARKIGSMIEQHHDINNLPRRVDVVYTTRWLTMGVSKSDPNWLDKFAPYCVTPSLMDYVSKPSKTIFMHDLPAMRGYEVLDEVLDGPQSWAFQQARHKMSSAMAILSWCLVPD